MIWWIKESHIELVRVVVNDHNKTFFPPTEAADEESIARLLGAVPQLESLFNVSRCIGHGTFSSVYLARIKHTTTINGRKHFAIKHIIPTSHPSRVCMELRCLKMIGWGTQHTKKKKKKKLIKKKPFIFPYVYCSQNEIIFFSIKFYVYFLARIRMRWIFPQYSTVQKKKKTYIFRMRLIFTETIFTIQKKTH